MKNKTILASMLVICFLVTMAFVGSAFLIRDGNPRGGTIFDLMNIAECVVALHNRGIDVSQFESLHDLVASASQEHLLFMTTERRAIYDNWRRPLHWKTRKNSDEVVVVIQSDGRNAIAEDGKGDDLSVVIVLPRNGEPTIKLIPPE